MDVVAVVTIAVKIDAVVVPGAVAVVKIAVVAVVSLG